MKPLTAPDIKGTGGQYCFPSGKMSRLTSAVWKTRSRLFCSPASMGCIPTEPPPSSMPSRERVIVSTTCWRADVNALECRSR